jgi:hypothetical protein
MSEQPHSRLDTVSRWLERASRLDPQVVAQRAETVVRKVDETLRDLTAVEGAVVESSPRLRTSASRSLAVPVLVLVAGAVVGAHLARRRTR